MKRFAILAWLAVAVLGCSSGGANTPDSYLADAGQDSRIETNDKTQDIEDRFEISAVIGPDGGRIESTDPTHSLYGTVLDVPAGALTEDTVVSMERVQVADEDLAETAKPTGLSLRLGPTGTSFRRPVFLTLPYDDSAFEDEEFPLVLIRDNDNDPWRFAAPQDADEDAHTVTVRLTHFSQVVPVQVAPSSSTPKTGFRPAVDGFFCLNAQPLPAACSKGACMGFAAFSKWYFHEKKAAYGPLVDKFHTDDDPKSATGCTETKQIACDAWKAYIVYKNGLSFWEIVGDFREISASYVFRTIKAAIDLTGQPVVITATGDDVAHALVVYDYDGKKLYVYDNAAADKFGVVEKELVGWKTYYLGSTEFTNFYLVSDDEFKGYSATYETLFGQHGISACPDEDGDGSKATWCGGDDCNEDDDRIGGMNVETCDGLDNNCDGRTDELFPVLGNVCVSGLGACASTGTYVCSSDGQDAVCSATPIPGEDETCNGLDDNCDGRTDEEDAAGCTPYFVDGDNDGFGAGNPRCLCAPEAPYVAEADGDCRDDKAKVHPEAEEKCDGLDNDCNDQTDEGGVCVEPCVDNDSDGFGVGPGCTGPADCDDTKAKVYPGAAEKCDGLDNDCDTKTDEDEVCGEPPFENPDDTETEDVQVTVTQVETTPGSKQIKLFAKVETQQGKPLQQLTIGNFVLRETIGGSTQTLPLDSLFAAKETTESMSAGLLIDSSGSMGSGEGSPLAQAKVAAKLFVSKLKPQDAAAVIDFGSDVHVNADFTNDKQTLFGAIDACSDGGMTSMYDALSTGINMIANRAGQRALVLLSDGGDNDSACSPCTPDDAVVPANDAGVPIFTIGLGATPGSGLESDLIAISNGTFAGQNGSGYYATVDPLGLQAIYDAIATVLKNMYVIGWYTQGASGQTVDVTITVTYTCAGGTFTDTFVTSYVVP